MNGIGWIDLVLLSIACRFRRRGNRWWFGRVEALYVAWKMGGGFSSGGRICVCCSKLYLSSSSLSPLGLFLPLSHYQLIPRMDNFQRTSWRRHHRHICLDFLSSRLAFPLLIWRVSPPSFGFALGIVFELGEAFCAHALREWIHCLLFVRRS
jgi:hypothetical protein